MAVFGKDKKSDERKISEIESLVRTNETDQKVFVLDGQEIMMTRILDNFEAFDIISIFSGFGEDAIPPAKVIRGLVEKLSPYILVDGVPLIKSTIRSISVYSSLCSSYVNLFMTSMNPEEDEQTLAQLEAIVDVIKK